MGDIPRRHGASMELRHLRYFVAVAEEGSLTLAAERRLHTAQPSLSRQIRDLEHEVGAQLLRLQSRVHRLALLLRFDVPVVCRFQLSQTFSNRIT